MGYDAWKQDDSRHRGHEERTERDEFEREAYEERSAPLYRLRVQWDPWLRWTVARLLVGNGDGTWRTLDEATAPGNSATEALRRMRQHRRLVRGVL